jgi:uncharacterized membrane protein YfbV (UPF0208 family)
MKDTEKTNLQKALDNFISELNKVAESCSETEFNDRLIEEVAPALTEEDQLFSTSIFKKLEVAVELSQLNSDNMWRSIESAMTLMSNDAICWFLNHIYTMNKTVEILKSAANGHDVGGPPTFRDRAERINRDKRELQKWLNNDLHERIQLYKNDIKKLQEEK